MKILTGTLRGRTILFRANPDLRPTTDKMRKAIFDMLQGALEGRQVLDLFSGTGALGFESLSQGAAHVTFVEQDRVQCKRIEDNVKQWNLEATITVESQGVLQWIAKYKGGPFDLILLDPPYETNVTLRTMEEIGRRGLVKKGGFAVLECWMREKPPKEIGSLKCIRQKLYGQTLMTVYSVDPGSGR